MWNVIEIELGHHLVSALVECPGGNGISVIGCVPCLCVPESDNVDVSTPSDLVQEPFDGLLNLGYRVLLYFDYLQVGERHDDGLRHHRRHEQVRTH